MSWAHYLLQANLYLIVFFVFYKVFLEGETYFKLNRSYLIAAGIFSLVIPFIRLEWFFRQPMTQKISAGVGQLTILISGGGNETTEQAVDWGSIVVFIYVAGVLFFLGRLLLQLLSVRKIFSRVNPGTAFTFFGRKSVDPNLPGQDTINVHEHIHIEQFHTADILFFEVIGIITWFNPVIYFYKHAVKNIHEYLADDAAAQYIGDKEAYAMLLLSKAFGVSPSTITNSFFNKSLIRKRILMLHKEKSRKRAILKYGLFVPLFSAMLILSSATLRQNEEILSVTKQIPLNTPMQVLKEVLTPDSAAAGLNNKNSSNTIKATKNQTAFAIAQHANEQATAAITSRLNELHVDSIPDPVLGFEATDIPPGFPGGIAKFYAYVGKNIKYPDEAVRNNVQGKVIMSFTVEKDGDLSDIRVERKAGSGLDEEAIRVIEDCPKWIPGKIKGESVRVRYNIPISFVLHQPATPTVKETLTLTMPGSGKVSQGPMTIRLNGKPVQDDVLYMIDGERSSHDAMAKINSNNIESISVIKNQTAAALYGPEGRNGVVLVKMKKKDIKDSWIK